MMMMMIVIGSSRWPSALIEFIGFYSDHAHRCIGYVVVNCWSFVPFVFFFVVNMHFAIPIKKVQTIFNHFQIEIFVEFRIINFFDLKSVKISKVNLVFIKICEKNSYFNCIKSVHLQQSIRRYHYRIVWWWIRWHKF